MWLKYFPYPIVFLLLWAGNVIAQKPIAPNLLYVSVSPQPSNPGSVNVVWSDLNSGSDHADGFNIYRFMDLPKEDGFYIVGTVRYPTFTFLDTSAKANEYPEKYMVQSFWDLDYNISEQSNHATTIFLQPIVFDTCGQTAELIWSDYIGWTQGIEGYKVIRNTEELTPIPKKETFFIDKKIVLGTNYEYYVKGISNKKGVGKYTSESNRFQILFTGFQKPDSNLFYINQIINKKTLLEIQAHVDVAADIEQYALLFSNQKDGDYNIAMYNNDLTAENLIFSYTYSGVPQYYKVAAIDNCNETARETQRVKPLQLKVEMQDYNVTLKWDTSFVDADNEAYEVFLIIDKEPAESQGIEDSFNLDELGTETSESYCFYVTTVDNLNHVSISQTECVTRTPVLDIPEAFSPNGDLVNDGFGPFVNTGIPEKSYIKDVTVTAFSLYIYDRYGGKIYYTDDATEFWDGKIKGVSVSAGGYLYYYTYTTSLGKSYKGSGAINVVYP